MSKEAAEGDMRTMVVFSGFLDAFSSAKFFAVSTASSRDSLRIKRSSSYLFASS